MNSTLHVWPQKHTYHDGWVHVDGVIEYPNGHRFVLRYSVPEQWANLVPAFADAFAIASVFEAMQNGLSLVIHGEVSSGLLRNLETFQSVWQCWAPDLYRQVDISAESEKLRDSAGRDAIALFSGGADACFLLHRHVRNNAGRNTRTVRRCVFVHGFDIPLERVDHFDRAFNRAETITKSVGVPLIPLRSNYRALKSNWRHSHGAALASCLTFAGESATEGLMASGNKGYKMIQPWGSTPLTDPLSLQ